MNIRKLVNVIIDILQDERSMIDPSNTYKVLTPEEYHFDLLFQDDSINLLMKNNGIVVNKEELVIGYSYFTTSQLSQITEAFMLTHKLDNELKSRLSVMMNGSSFICV